MEGAATHLEANKSFTVVYTAKGLLYVLSTESGRRVEIPFKMDALSKISLNHMSYLLLLEANGKLKVCVIKSDHKSGIEEDNSQERYQKSTYQPLHRREVQKGRQLRLV